MQKKLLTASFLSALLLLSIGQSCANPLSRIKSIRESEKYTADYDEANTRAAYTEKIAYACEQGNRLTVIQQDDPDRIALQWRNKNYQLSRVPTTTGAERYENRQAGLVWISIPSKSMLLDSKKGRQLANECRPAGQAFAASNNK